jgi:hypothetical protein
VRGEPVDLHHHDADQPGTLGDLHTEEPLDAQGERGLVEHGAEVVGAGQERDRLGPGAVLRVLLDARVQISDDHPSVGDGLPFQFQDEPEHTVGGRVLRAHVEHEPFFGDRVATAEHRVPVAAGDRVDPALGGLARRRVLSAARSLAPSTLTGHHR